MLHAYGNIYPVYQQSPLKNGLKMNFSLSLSKRAAFCEIAHPHTDDSSSPSVYRPTLQLCVRKNKMAARHPCLQAVCKRLETLYFVGPRSFQYFHATIPFQTAMLHWCVIALVLLPWCCCTGHGVALICCSVVYIP